MTLEEKTSEPTGKQIDTFLRIMKSVRELQACINLHCHYSVRPDDDAMKQRTKVLLEIVEEAFAEHFDVAIESFMVDPEVSE